MVGTSTEFNQAIHAPSRRTAARVTFDISDITAADDAQVAVTGESIISRVSQLTNKKRNRPRYATFEPGYWKLDGSFVLPPKQEDEGFEVGWYSEGLCDEDGVFGTPQVMGFSFSVPHSSVGLTIDFDTPTDEYATEFDVVAYDGGNGVLKTIEVRDNTESHCIIEEPLIDYRRIEVTTRKWCKPYRRAKVVEVSFGVVRVYEDDKLIRLNLLEEISPTSETVPANELKFVVDNSSREFNILNPQGSYKFLHERQVVIVELGLKIAPNVFEYIGMGYYYLTDWQSDEGSLTTTFTARNLIDFIPDAEVENLVPATTTLHDLAVQVLTEAGIVKYTLDPVLETISTAGVYRRATYRQLLQMVAVAGQCVMYVDRNDVLCIERLSTGASRGIIDFDNAYQEPQIKLDRLVSKIEVNYYSDVDTVTGTHTATGLVDGGATLKVENTLISTQAHAQTVAEWILAESQQRAIYEVNWRQNPALECGDWVDIEDSYGANKQSRITQQEFEYAGYLSGKTKSRGVLP